MRSVLTALCLFATTAHAVPAQFTHQGRLLDAEGAPLEADTTITFRILDAETDGGTLWEETLTVSLTNGFYSTVLGADETNPLDTDILGQDPVWLELQLDGEEAMAPRSSINAVPYATMSTVAEEVSGGPVDASDISVGGTPVVNESGEWVGPAPTVSWDDLTDVPADFADGVDDDTLPGSDSFADLGVTCMDGDIPVWDGTTEAWSCTFDQDSLADMDCTEGQIVRWNEEAIGWICSDDIDTVLGEEEVNAIVSGVGYAMASEVFSGSFLDLADLPDGLLDGDDNTQLTAAEVDAIVSDNGYAMTEDLFSGLFNELTDIPDGLLDGDDNTQLSEAEVDAFVENNGYAAASDVFSGAFSDLAGVPEGLNDGDDDTLAATACGDGETLVYALATSSWACGTDTDTTLTAGEVQAMVEAVSGLALNAGATVDGSPVLSAANHGSDPDAHHSSTSDGLHITPASVALSGSDTQLVDGQIDLGSEGDDALTASMVQTLTGGGDADTLHSHAASSSGGSGRIGYLGVTNTMRAGDATLEVMENDCAAAFGAARMCTYSQIKNSYPAPRPETQSWIYVDNTTGDGWNVYVAELGDTFDNSHGVSVYNRYIFDNNPPLNCTLNDREGAFVQADISLDRQARYSMPALTILPSGQLNRVGCEGTHTVACCGPL